MLAMMSYFRENSLRSIGGEDELNHLHDGQINESIWNNTNSNSNMNINNSNMNNNWVADASSSSSCRNNNYQQPADHFLPHNHHHHHHEYNTNNNVGNHHHHHHSRREVAVNQNDALMAPTSFSAKGFDWEAGAASTTHDETTCSKSLKMTDHQSSGGGCIAGAPWPNMSLREDTPSKDTPIVVPPPSSTAVAFQQQKRKQHAPQPPPKTNKRRKTSTTTSTGSSTGTISARKTLTPLPLDFEPLPYSILCGQGNEYFNAVGNRRFRVTVSMFLQRYQKAKDRQEKSAIVTTVMDILNDACPSGAFIKYRDGRWWVVDEKTAREKVGAHFRDSLSEKYKSSAKAKIARRRDRELAKRRNSGRDSMASTTNTTSCASSVASESN